MAVFDANVLGVFDFILHDLASFMWHIRLRPPTKYSTPQNTFPSMTQHELNSEQHIFAATLLSSIFQLSFIYLFWFIQSCAFYSFVMVTVAILRAHINGHWTIDSSLASKLIPASCICSTAARGATTMKSVPFFFRHIVKCTSISYHDDTNHIHNSILHWLRAT